MLSADKKLNHKQLAFIKEYLIDKNATQAAIRAGYSARTAHSQGARLLTHVEIKVALSGALEKQIKRIDLDADRVLLEIYRILKVKIGDVLNDDMTPRLLSEMTEDAQRAVSRVVVRVERDEDGDEVARITDIHLWSKTESAKMLGKHFELFLDRIRIEQPNVHTSHDLQEMIVMLLRQLAVEAQTGGLVNVPAIVKQLRLQLDAVEAAGRAAPISGEIAESKEE